MMTVQFYVNADQHHYTGHYYGKDIIRTVVRIAGMGRMSHIYNTKCSRL